MSDLVAKEMSMPAHAGAPGTVTPARAEAVLSLLREDVEAAGKATHCVRLGANVATLSLLFAEAPAVVGYLRELAYRWPVYAHTGRRTTILKCSSSESPPPFWAGRVWQHSRPRRTAVFARSICGAAEHVQSGTTNCSAAAP